MPERGAAFSGLQEGFPGFEGEPAGRAEIGGEQGGELQGHRHRFHAAARLGGEAGQEVLQILHQVHIRGAGLRRTPGGRGASARAFRAARAGVLMRHARDEPRMASLLFCILTGKRPHRIAFVAGNRCSGIVQRALGC